MDFQVITRDPITKEITLVPPQPPRAMSGVKELFQIVVLSLLNNPGRNAQYPLMGSGIPAMVGQYNMSSSTSSDVFSEMVGRVEKVKNEVIENQRNLKKAPPSELLSDLMILNVEQGVTADSVRIRFRLITQDGTEEDFVI